LGVLYLETADLQKAKENFEKQVAYNDLAENHFYMAKVLIAQSEIAEAKLELDKAKTLFHKGYVMSDAYVYPADKIYLSMLEEMEKFLN
jgi:tetratricopeptide (TPR) repeat protein